MTSTAASRSLGVLSAHVAAASSSASCRSTMRRTRSIMRQASPIGAREASTIDAPAPPGDAKLYVMSAAHPVPPAELEVALRKLVKGDPLSRSEGMLVYERVDELVGEPVHPEDAPFDDEPVTPEEEALVAEARAEVSRGELIPAAEVYRRLGL
jgi:hypothetical protein